VVSIKAEDGAVERVTVTPDTFIRGTDPRIRFTPEQVDKVAYPGAHVIVLVNENKSATVLRENFY
jgi:hypothetical protein